MLQNHSGYDISSATQLDLLATKARAAEAVYDWDAAKGYWSSARDVAPGDRDAVLGYATALLRLKRIVEAEAVFATAPEEFNDNLEFAITRAQCTQEIGDIDKALVRWDNVRTRFVTHPYAHAAVASLYLVRGDYDAAEAVINPALTQFPFDVSVLASAVQIAVIRRDWPTATERLFTLRTTYPDHPLTSTTANVMQEAIANGIANATNETLRATALAAESRGDWEAAQTSWEQLYLRNKEVRENILGLGRSAREAGDITRAATIFDEAIVAYPDDPEIWANHAQVAVKAGELQKAADQWRIVLARFPDTPGFVNLAADALHNAGATLEAEAMIEAALEKDPQWEHHYISKAYFAQRAERWRDAIELWNNVIRLRPDVPVYAQLRGRALWNARLHQNESGTAADIETTENHQTPSQEDDPARLKRLMMKFESLGDNCEFGLVQRHFGAEPLGLFRFAGLRPETQVDLIQEKFERLGDPAHSFVKETPDDYVIEDDRGLYEMHTFLRRNDIEPEKLRVQQIKRIDFLKRKIIEDLQTGEKIFVCKDSKFPITDELLSKMSSAIAAYGPGLLLGVRVADAQNPRGSLVRLADRIVIGHIGVMWGNNDGAESDFESWQSILEAADRYNEYGSVPQPTKGIDKNDVDRDRVLTQ